MMRALLVGIAVAGCAAGCVSVQAGTPVERPNLDVPPVPPRVIEALPVQAAVPPEPVEDLPPVTSAPARPRPAAPAPPKEAVRTEPRPAETPAEPPAPAPAAAPAPVSPTPQLRTPATPDGAEAARQVRDLIERARRTLGSIDYAHLSPERRSQFDSARLMVTQAEDAVKASNFEFARNLAEKAERLATELKGR